MSVEVEALVDHFGVAGDQDVTGAPEFDERVARFVDAGGEGGQDVIGAADDQCGSGSQAGLCGGLRAELTDLRSGAPDRREDRGVESGRGEHGVGDVTVDGEKPGLHGPVPLHMHVGAQRG